MSAVVRGDALSIPLRDASVDLIVTSPPYFGQRSYCRLARWRVFDSPGAGKVADRTAGERQGALL